MPRASDPSPSSPPAGPPPRRSRRALEVVLAGLIALVALALLVLTRPPIATRVVNSLLASVPSLPRARMSVEDVRGSWLADLEVRGFRMTRGDSVLVHVDTLRVQYGFLDLLAGRIHISQLDLAGVGVSAGVLEPRAPEPGRPPLSIADLLRGRFYSGPAIDVDRASLRRGSFGADAAPADSGLRVEGLDLALRDLKLGRGFALTLDSLAARLRSPAPENAWARLHVAGRVADGRADVRTLQLVSAASDVSGTAALAAAADSLGEIRIALHGQRIALGDVRGFIRGFNAEGDVTADIDVHGPRMDRLSGSVDARAGEVQTGGLSFGPSQLNARLTDGRADLTATTAHEGAGLAARGWIRPLDADPAFDVTLRMDRLPRRLKGVAGREQLAQRAPTSADVRVRGHGYAQAVLDLTGTAKSAAGAATLDARLDASHGPAWEVLRLAFTNLDVARITGDTTASAFTGVLTARGRGFALDSLRAGAELSLVASHYGALHLRSANLRARADGAAISLSGRADGEGGGVVSGITANARLDGARPFHVRGLRFDHLDLAHITGSSELASDLNGTLAVDGRLGPPLAVTGHARLEPSRLRGRAVTGGVADVSLERGAITLTAQVETDAGSIAARADGRPFASPPEYTVHEARFMDLDLGAWGVASVPTRLNGWISATSRDSAGTHGGMFADLRLDRSRIGALEVEGGNAEGQLRAGHVHAKGSLRATRGAATFTGDASWDSTRAGFHDLAGRGGFIVPFSVLAGLAGRDTLPTTGAVYGDVTAGGDPSGALRLAGVLAGRGSIGAARIDTLFAGLRYEGGALQLDTLDVRSNVARARASGRIALGDSAGAAPTDVRLVATVTDLAPLAALVGADSLDVGSGELEARLMGPAGKTEFSVTTSLRTLAWNNVRLLRANVDARGTLDRNGRPVDVHGTAGMGRFHSPEGDVQEATATVEYAAGILDARLDAVLDDTHRVRLAGEATADSSVRTITLRTADVDANAAHWRLTGPARVRWGRGRIEIGNFEARSDSGVARVSGVLDRHGDQDFHSEVRGAGLDILAAWSGRPDLTGRLDGEFALVGPATMPRGAGWMRVAGLVSGEPAGDLGVDLAWDGRRLDAHGAFTSPQQDSLVVTARLPLEVSAAADSGGNHAPVRVVAGDVDLRLQADRFPLNALLPWLPPQTVSALDGTLDSDARLAGTGNSFVGTGHINVADGRITMPALGTTFDGIRVDGALAGNRLEVREARATSGKGNLRASGEVRFTGTRSPEVDLLVKTDRFTFMNMRDVRAIVSSDLRVAGRADEPHVTGQSSLGGSYYFITPADMAAAQAAEAVPLTPADVHMMEETFGYLGAPAVDPGLALYDASDLDVQVQLGRDNWLRQRSAPRFAVEATGDVHLKKSSHAEPELFGRIAPVPGHGYVEQFGRTFDIAGGEILLNGDMKDHTVDLRAEYKTRSSSGSGESDVVVHLGVTGPVDKLRLALTSDPPLSENDILTFIATGRDPTSAQAQTTGSNSSTASLAADIGMSQLTGGLQSAAQEKAGLDVLQIRFDAQQGATLVAGRYVGSTVYLGVRQPLQYHESSTTDSSTPYRTRFEVEYEKYQWLVFNLQGEVDLLRAFLRARHAY